MEALGRLFNAVPLADDVWIDLSGATAITFVGFVAAGDTYEIEEATDGAGTGGQVLDVVERYYENTSGAGAGTWSLVEQTADSQVVTSAPAVVIHVSANSLSAGFTHVRCTIGTGTDVFALVHDLSVQRLPDNLPQLAA